MNKHTSRSALSAIALSALISPLGGKLPAVPLSVDASDVDTPVSFRDGDLVAYSDYQISVFGQPSSGFSWTPYFELGEDADVIRLSETSIEISGGTGAGGRLYSFRPIALRPGSTVIGLSYDRGTGTFEDPYRISADWQFNVTVDDQMNITIRLKEN